MTSQNERILLAHNVQPDSRWYGSTLWGNVVAVCRNSSQLESTPLQHKQAGMVYSLKWTRRLIFEFSRTLAYTIVDWRNAGVDAQRQRENLYNYRRRNNNTNNNTNLSGFFSFMPFLIGPHSSSLTVLPLLPFLLPPGYCLHSVFTAKSAWSTPLKHWCCCCCYDWSSTETCNILLLWYIYRSCLGCM